MVERKELILFFSKINKFSPENLISLVTASCDHFKLYDLFFRCVKKRSSRIFFYFSVAVFISILFSRDFHKQSWNNAIVTYTLMWLWITVEGQCLQLQRVHIPVSKQ